MMVLVPGLPAAQAQIALLEYTYIQCNLGGRVCVNPLDSSVWVTYYGDDSSSNTYFITNFARDGHRIAQFQIPSNRQPLTITFLPNDIRFYYEEKDPAKPEVFTAFGYVDLLTGQTHKLFDTATIAGGCTLENIYFSEAWYFNSARNQFYLPCTSYFNSSGKPEIPTRTAIIDTTTNKLIKLVDFGVVGLNPSGNKFYAYKEYYETISPGYQEKYYDLYEVNDQTFEATTDQPLLKHQDVYTALTSFKVNGRTGLAYFTTHYCYAKCGTLQGAVVDGTGKFVVPLSVPKVTQYTALNGGLNRVYGYNYYAAQFGRQELDVYDGANVTGERLAQLYWQPAAYDLYNNLTYAISEGTTKGEALLVINSKTNSVQSFIQLKAPPASFTDKAKPVPAPSAGTPGEYFKETGHTLSGKFLDYWQKNGGLAGFGYPITEPFQEDNMDNNRNLTVQYFERARLELHPENAGTPYEIELGLLGHNFSALTGPRVNDRFISGETSPVEGGLLFKETGHTVTGKFLEYWQSHGGLARHGLPLTQPTSEVNPIDGKTYLVQYFERSRLELHPEFAGTEYEVLLGLLGTQSLRANGWPV